MSGDWIDLAGLLDADTAYEADWAAKHAPNICTVPRGWRFPAIITENDVELRDTETPSERVVRLAAMGFMAGAIAAALDKSPSRISQILREERIRVGAIQAG